MSRPVADRDRPRTIWAAAALVMAIVVLAASSGTIRLWTAPETDSGPGIATSDPEPRTPAPEQLGQVDAPAWLGPVLEVLALITITAVVVMTLIAASRYQWWLPLRPLQRRLRSVLRTTEPLPDGPDILQVDVTAALTALSDGEPRNAIVACWMQLEHDAAAMGFERLPAETSSEYVARVVTAASVDPGPISELGALFREARFSEHELGSSHRERASDALHRVVDALRTSSGTPA